MGFTQTVSAPTTLLKYGAFEAMDYGFSETVANKNAYYSGKIMGDLMGAQFGGGIAAGGYGLVNSSLTIAPAGAILQDLAVLQLVLVFL